MMGHKNGRDYTFKKLKNSIKPCMIPVINDGGSDGSLLDMMYGRLPMIGKRGGPGGKLLGFFVAL